jgi:hypothetical protein
MTIDDLVRKLMTYQEGDAPGEDPGDLVIEWQDDSSLVTATQYGYGPVGIGQTAEEALRNYAHEMGYEL